MDISFFLKGLVLGFSIAAPVGPIGILCIRRTLQFGRLSGLFSGLGAAAADVIYAMIAVCGLTFISNFLVAGHFWLQSIGGLFLMYLGWKTFFVRASGKGKEVSHTTFLNDFASTFFLTITNPMTIFSFLAVFASLGLSNGSYFEAIILVVGVFLGSAAWWFLLSEGITLFREKVSDSAMLWVNRIAGITIAAFGIAVWVTLLLS